MEVGPERIQFCLQYFFLGLGVLLSAQVNGHAGTSPGNQQVPEAGDIMGVNVHLSGDLVFGPGVDKIVRGFQLKVAVLVHSLNLHREALSGLFDLDADFIEVECLAFKGQTFFGLDLSEVLKRRETRRLLRRRRIGLRLGKGRHARGPGHGVQGPAAQPAAAFHIYRHCEPALEGLVFLDPDISVAYPLDDLDLLALHIKEPLGPGTAFQTFEKGPLPVGGQTGFPGKGGGAEMPALPFAGLVLQDGVVVVRPLIVLALPAFVPAEKNHVSVLVPVDDTAFAARTRNIQLFVVAGAPAAVLGHLGDLVPDLDGLVFGRLFGDKQHGPGRVEVRRHAGGVGDEFQLEVGERDAICAADGLGLGHGLVGSVDDLLVPPVKSLDAGAGFPALLVGLGDQPLVGRARIRLFKCFLLVFPAARRSGLAVLLDVLLKIKELPAVNGQFSVRRDQDQIFISFGKPVQPGLGQLFEDQISSPVLHHDPGINLVAVAQPQVGHGLDGYPRQKLFPGVLRDIKELAGARGVNAPVLDEHVSLRDNSEFGVGEAAELFHFVQAVVVPHPGIGPLDEAVPAQFDITGRVSICVARYLIQIIPLPVEAGLVFLVDAEPGAFVGAGGFQAASGEDVFELFALFADGVVLEYGLPAFLIMDVVVSGLVRGNELGGFPGAALGLGDRDDDAVIPARLRDHGDDPVLVGRGALHAVAQAVAVGPLFVLVNILSFLGLL